MNILRSTLEVHLLSRMYIMNGNTLGHFSEQRTDICHENQTNGILEQICDLIARLSIYY